MNVPNNNLDQPGITSVQTSDSIGPSGSPGVNSLSTGGPDLNFYVSEDLRPPEPKGQKHVSCLEWDVQLSHEFLDKLKSARRNCALECDIFAEIWLGPDYEAQIKAAITPTLDEFGIKFPDAHRMTIWGVPVHFMKENGIRVGRTHTP